MTASGQLQQIAAQMAQEQALQAQQGQASQQPQPGQPQGVPGIGGPGFNPAQGGIPPAMAAPFATREQQTGRAAGGGLI